MNTAAFRLALAAFARDEGITAEHQHRLVLGQAGWHTAKDLVLPEGLHLAFLPPASPELQPAERLWSLVDEPVANQTFADLDDLEATLVTRCQDLEQQRPAIQTHTRYH